MDQSVELPDCAETPKRKSWKIPTKAQIREDRIDVLGRLPCLPDESLIDLKTACALADVSVHTAWRRIKAGKWEAVYVGGLVRLHLGRFRRVLGLRSVENHRVRRTGQEPDSK